jgi:hypothetical protein
MVCSQPPSLLALCDGAWGPHQHLVPGLVQQLRGDVVAVVPRRQQRRLVHQVGQLGAGEAGGAAGQQLCSGGGATMSVDA